MSLKAQMLPEDGVVDAFDSAAARLAVLLDLEPRAEVLLVGEAGRTRPPMISDGHDGYEDIAHAMAAGLVQGGRRYGLIVWAPRPSRDAADLSGGLEYLRHLLGANGTLLLLVPNRLSLRSARRKPGRLLNRRLRTRGQYRRLLRSSRFTSVREFLSFPAFRFPTELVAAEAGLELPANPSVLERGLHVAGALPLFHESYAYLLSNANASGPDRLVQKLAQRLEELQGVHPRLRLERSALRTRGALILFLTDQTCGQRLLCRITTSDEVDRVVGENLRWTSELHANARLAEAVKGMIPAPVASFELDGCRVYIEELLPGSIAWKLAAKRRVEGPLFESASGFLGAVGEATVRERTLSVDELSAHLPLPDLPWYDDEFAGLMADLRGHLARRLQGQSRAFCVSHGDFGYGNLLADPKQRRLTGVIDWDQAREDLYGVDLANFLIQRRRITEGESLSEALRQVGDRVIERGFDTVVPRAAFGDRLPLHRAQRAELFAWTIWRCVERDSRYRRDYVQGRDQLAGCMRWAIARMAA